MDCTALGRAFQGYCITNKNILMSDAAFYKLQKHLTMNASTYRWENEMQRSRHLPMVTQQAGCRARTRAQNNTMHCPTNHSTQPPLVSLTAGLPHHPLPKWKPLECKELETSEKKPVQICLWSFGKEEKIIFTRVKNRQHRAVKYSHLHNSSHTLIISWNFSSLICSNPSL